MKHHTGNPLPDCHKPALPLPLSALWHQAALRERLKKEERDLALLPREEKIKRRCPEKNFHGDKEHAKSRLEQRMEYERMKELNDRFHPRFGVYAAGKNKRPEGFNRY